MDQTILDDMGDTERLLLAAAFVERARAGSIFRSCRHVTDRVIVWDEQCESDVEELQPFMVSKDHPSVDEYYQRLIDWFEPSPLYGPLLEGRGDFGSPTTSRVIQSSNQCRLTSEGEQFAHFLVFVDPQFQDIREAIGLPETCQSDWESASTKLPDLDEFSELERYLLIATFIVGGRPGSLCAKCAGPIGQALSWAGLYDDKVELAFVGDHEHPQIDQCYDKLISWFQPTAVHEALMEGRGNFGSENSPRSASRYTDCRLSIVGEQLAQRLLEMYPQYRV